MRKSTCVTRPETGERFTCTSIGDRKMLICFHSPGGAAVRVGRPGDEHAAVGRRQHERRILRRDAIGIAEEEEKERGEDEQWHGAGGADGQSRRNRKSGRATDEGITCAIDRHTTILILIDQCEIAAPP